jgi:hypothetical protein
MKMDSYLRFEWDELKDNWMINISAAKVNMERAGKTQDGKKAGRATNQGALRHRRCYLFSSLLKFQCHELSSFIFITC